MASRCVGVGGRDRRYVQCDFRAQAKLSGMWPSAARPRAAEPKRAHGRVCGGLWWPVRSRYKACRGSSALDIGLCCLNSRRHWSLKASPWRAHRAGGGHRRGGRGVWRLLCGDVCRAAADNGAVPELGCRIIGRTHAVPWFPYASRGGDWRLGSPGLATLLLPMINATRPLRPETVGRWSAGRIGWQTQGPARVACRIEVAGAGHGLGHDHGHMPIGIRFRADRLQPDIRHGPAQHRL